MNKTNFMPVLYSLPVVETLTLPKRADLLPKIESGELEFLDFRAKVFTNGLNRNPYRFRDEDLAAFAASFEGQPFLRDHETDEIEAREGTILTSAYNGQAFVQDIRITTRRGMLDYLEGRIDRFSIGWFYDDCLCSICQSGFFSNTCTHWPGQKYNTLEGEKTCELIFLNPKGKETSAVNVPAVEGTGIVAQLKEYKREFLGVEEIAELKQSEINLTDGQEPVSEDATKPDAQARESGSRMRRVKIAQFSISETVGEHIMNIRELLKQRNALVEEAKGLTELADTENRDLTEDERARFNAILGDEGEAVILAKQINTILAERERLQEAVALKFANAEAEKPEPHTPAPKTSMKRGEFEALDALEKAAWVKAGNSIED